MNVAACQVLSSMYSTLLLLLFVVVFVRVRRRNNRRYFHRFLWRSSRVLCLYSMIPPITSFCLDRLGFSSRSTADCSGLRRLELTLLSSLINLRQSSLSSDSLIDSPCNTSMRQLTLWLQSIVASRRCLERSDVDSGRR
jgi:hypothetical protein